MDKREQKIVLEKFLAFHGIKMLATARLPHYGRRFRAFFPDIAEQVHPGTKPWTSTAIDRLADMVAILDPSAFVKSEARPFHVAAKYRKQNKVKTFLMSWEWREVRYEVLRDRGARCELCGATSADRRIEVDHIKPISKHWHLRLDKRNLQVLCRDCNMGKNNRHVDDFRCRAA